MRRIALQLCFFAVLGFAINGCVREAGAPDFSQQDAAAQVTEVKAEIDVAKETMAHEGKYKCCVKPPCDWCLLKASGCSCESMVDTDQPVCPECGLGWKQGKGSLEGYEAKDIKNVMEN